MSNDQPESGLSSDQNVEPTTSGSQTSGDKPISRLDEGARAEVSKIVETAISKFTSVKDRGIAKATKVSKEAQIAVDQLRDTLEARGLLNDDISKVLDKVQQDSEFVELKNMVASLLEKGIGSPSPGARIVYDDAFKAAGYDMTTLSPEDQAFAINGVEQGTFKDQIDLKNALVKRRADQQKTKPVPDGSGIVSPGGGGVPPDPGVKTVTDEYAEKYAKAANEGASQDELLSIKAEYRTKGAAVDSVRFSYKTGTKPG